MEIILKEDVVNLGYKNDIVTVKSGYGRNYLIPTGKAVIASPAAKKMLAEELKQRAHKLEKIKKDAETVAEQLKEVSLTIATKVSATGTIFGSVSNIQIAEELAKLGHNIDRKIIVVKGVKEVGSYTATVKLHKEVSLTIATKVSATGTIFGSVSNIQIAEELAKLGHNVDRKIIFVKGVKEVGSYTATVKLHKEVSVEIPFEVVAEAE